MPRIQNWIRERRSPTLAYRHTELRTRAVLHRTPDTHNSNWRGVILSEGYLVWSRNYETKESAAFPDVLREWPVPKLACPECPNDDVLVGEKSADGATVQRWYDCPDCGYEAPSRVLYGAER